jgi:hypothetical protein
VRASSSARAGRVSFGESVEVAVGAGEADRDAAAQREVAEVGHEWHGSPARVRLRRVLRSARAQGRGVSRLRGTPSFWDPPPPDPTRRCGGAPLRLIAQHESIQPLRVR